MRQFLEYVKQNKKYRNILLLVLFAVLVIIPFLINVLFKIASPCGLLVAEWDAGNVLTFYGTVLSFLSTSALSVLALWQNRVIKKESDKHTAILERMERKKNLPVFLIEAEGYESAQNLFLTIKNLSENFAQNITVSNYYIRNSEGTEINGGKLNHYIPLLTISDSRVIFLRNPPITDRSHRIYLDFEYNDIFGDIHKCTAIGIFADAITTPTFIIKENTNEQS